MRNEYCDPLAMLGGAGAPDERAHREAGFTLVEMLVGLALLSFISVALLSSLRFGVTAWHRGHARASSVEQVALAQALLRRLIADTYPLLVLDDPTRPRIAFDGGPRSLALLAPTPLALGGAGRALFTLAIEQRVGQSDLMVAIQPELGDRSDRGSIVRRVVLRDIESADLSYFGKARADRVAQWHESWVREIAIPSLVRVQVRFAEGDDRRWPELLVAPRIAADVGCVYDPLTRRCRGR